MSVVGAVAQATEATQTIQLVGSLKAVRHIELLAEAAGLVEILHADEGDRVAAGAPLFDIDARRQSANLKEAEAARDLARLDLARAEALAAEGAVADHELERSRATAIAAEAAVERARVGMREARVRAPFAGTVGRRLLSPGQWVTPGTLLTTLTDTDELEIEAAVPERFVAALAPGRRIDVRVAAWPAPVSGVIAFVSPIVDPATRSVTVVGRIVNTDGRLRPGMFAEAKIELGRRPAVRIPASALEFRGDTVQVWVIDADGLATPQPVVVLTRDAEFADIGEGLTAGARVVREGQQKLRPGVLVRERDQEPSNVR
jgi:RND family efflux transporter MFP subunit